MKDKGIKKEVTDWKYFDFLIDDNEKCIMKFQVSTFKNHIYVYYLFKNKDKYYLKYVNFNGKDCFDLLLSNAKKLGLENMSLGNVLDILVKNSEYIKQFKVKFMIIKNLEYDVVSDYIEKINKLDFNHNRPTITGFDGFHVDAKIYDFDFWSHNYCTEPYFRPFIEFINYLLDITDVHNHYRFHFSV